MSRTLGTTLLLALLAAPMALAQHGPPPGQTDPNEYAQDYAKQQIGEASADPAGYAQGLDAGAEAEHAAWLACWEAYEAAGHALDAACSRFFTAPVTVEPDAQAVEAEITQALNDTGASALGSEALDIVNDTVADPASALGQVRRAAGAVVRFVEGLVDFVLDTLGLGGLAIAAGVLGALQGLLDLATMPLDGLGLAAQGLADIGAALASILGLAGSGVAAASSAASHAALGAVTAMLGAVQDAAGAAGAGVAAAVSALVSAAQATVVALGDAAGATASGIGDGAQALAGGVTDAADAVRDTVREAAQKVGSLFDGGPKRPSGDRAGLPDAPETGTGADGLLDGILDKL